MWGMTQKNSTATKGLETAPHTDRRRLRALVWA